ncbi:hypothetical protein TELCIR_12514, partial [Teladorsagia circumcincta]
LERAVAVLKAAPMGKIRIGVAKPIPIDQLLKYEAKYQSRAFVGQQRRRLIDEAKPDGDVVALLIRQFSPVVNAFSLEEVAHGDDDVRCKVWGANEDLERAVAVLKAAPMGKIRIGVAKPIPIDQLLKYEAKYQSRAFVGQQRRRLIDEAKPDGDVVALLIRQFSPVVNAFSLEEVAHGDDDVRLLQCPHYLPLSDSAVARDVFHGYLRSVLNETASKNAIAQKSPVSSVVNSSQETVWIGAEQYRRLHPQWGSIPDKAFDGSAPRQWATFAIDYPYQYVRMKLWMALYSSKIMGNIVTYITAADARVWKERFHHDNEGSLPVINRLSPK